MLGMTIDANTEAQAAAISQTTGLRMYWLVSSEYKHWSARWLPTCPVTLAKGRHTTHAAVVLSQEDKQRHATSFSMAASNSNCASASMHTLASMHTHTLTSMHTLCVKTSSHAVQHVHVNTTLLLLLYCCSGAGHPHRLKDRHWDILSLIHRCTIVILNCSCQYRNKNIKKLINEKRGKKIS